MIVITGASDGLGKAVAELYKKSGKKVVNISMHKSEFADKNIVLDLREGANIIEAANQIKKIDEQIEAIINCVGVYNEQRFGEITEDEIKRLMASNLKAPMLFISELIDRIKKDQADVLNVLSTAATRGRKDNPLYSASKWAERGFSFSLQEELKDTSSRVINFCPGGIRTRFSEKALGVDQSQPNWMKPEDLAKFIKQILDLPKNIEVSEVVINRKEA